MCRSPAPMSSTMGVSKEAPEKEKPSSVGTSGMLLFAGIIGAIAGNVLMARRYGKRVMSFKVPEEALHRDSPHVERNHFASFWEPEARRARWDAYMKRAEEEEKRRMQRLYEWVMHEREKEHLRQKMHRFYQQRPFEWGSSNPNQQQGWQQQRRRRASRWGGFRAERGWYRMKKGDKTFYGDPDDWEEEEEGEEEDLGFASKVRRSKRALGLREDEPVTEEEVKQAFRQQALKYHPDRSVGSDKQQNTTRFKEANEAYSFLIEQLGGQSSASRAQG